MAESRGFVAKKRRRAEDEDGRVNRVMRTLPNLLGPMWVLWAIAVGLTFGSAMAALPVMILISVVVMVTASNAGRNADKVPLAYGRDLRAHVTPERLPELLASRPQVRVERGAAAAEPAAAAPAPPNVAAPVVAPPAPKTRGGQLLARVEESLAALELAIGQAELHHHLVDRLGGVAGARLARPGAAPGLPAAGLAGVAKLQLKAAFRQGQRRGL